VATVEKTAAAAPVAKRMKPVSALDDAIEAANMPQTEVSPQVGKGKVKKQKAPKMYEDAGSDEDDMGMGRKSDERLKRLSKDPTGGDTGMPGGLFDDMPAMSVKPRKSKKAPAKEFDPFNQDEDDDDVEPQQALASGLKIRGDKSHRGATGAKRQAGRDLTGAGGGSGILGLSHEKMMLVRQKKDEIEKAYRQDCETFATVTKMLINKEPSLEDKIQDSLRENLKEIGQRCIQELREFIDRLREDEEQDDADNM
jgi:hypothetical protein